MSYSLDMRLKGLSMFKRLKKKLIYLIPIILILAYALPVLAAFTADIVVVETSGNAYTQLPIKQPASVYFMAGNSYMTTSGLDTRVYKSGVALPHSLTSSNIYFVDDVAASSSQNYQFVTGEVALADLDIIPGYNGYFYIPDTATLEPANNFVFNFQGYIDTTDIYANNQVMKEGAYATAVTANGQITSAILAAESAQETQAAGANDIPIALTYQPCQAFTPATTHFINRVDVTSGVPAGAPPAGDITLSIRIATGGLPSGVDLTSDSIASGTWAGAGGVNTFIFDNPIYVVAGTQYEIVIVYPNGNLGGGNYVTWRMNNAGAYAGGTAGRSLDGGLTWASLGAGWDAVFTERGYILSNSVTAIGVTSGNRQVFTSATGGGTNLLNIEVYTSGGAIIDVDTVALAGASVPDNGNDWFVMRNNSMPYMDYYTETVGGVIILIYQPVSYLKGTTYSTGTATFTNGSPIVTGAATVWTDAMVGGWIESNVTLVWHQILSVESPTSLTLTVNYTAASGAGEAYQMRPVLEDEVGADEDAIIVEGANPSGLTSSISNFIGTSTNTASITGGEVADVIGQYPNINIPSMESMALAGHEWYGWLNGVAGLAGVSIQMAWWFIAMMLTIVAVVLTYFFSGHLWGAGIAGSAIIGFFVALGALPSYAIIFAVIIFVFFGLMERVTSI